MDVESFDNGILGAIVINEGGVANVGSPIAYIAESEADIEAAKAKAGGGAAASTPAPAPVSSLCNLISHVCLMVASWKVFLVGSTEPKSCEESLECRDCFANFSPESPVDSYLDGENKRNQELKGMAHSHYRSSRRPRQKKSK